MEIANPFAAAKHAECCVASFDQRFRHCQAIVPRAPGEQPGWRVSSGAWRRIEFGHPRVARGTIPASGTPAPRKRAQAWSSVAQVRSPAARSAGLVDHHARRARRGRSRRAASAPHRRRSGWSAPRSPPPAAGRRPRPGGAPRRPARRRGRAAPRRSRAAACAQRRAAAASSAAGSSAGQRAGAGAAGAGCRSRHRAMVAAASGVSAAGDARRRGPRAGSRPSWMSTLARPRSPSNSSTRSPGAGQRVGQRDGETRSCRRRPCRRRWRSARPCGLGAGRSCARPAEPWRRAAAAPASQAGSIGTRPSAAPGPMPASASARPAAAAASTPPSRRVSRAASPPARAPARGRRGADLRRFGRVQPGRQHQHHGGVAPRRRAPQLLALGRVERVAAGRVDQHRRAAWRCAHGAGQGRRVRRRRAGSARAAG